MKSRVVLSTVVVALVCTACSVGTQEEPTAVADDDVPFGLVEPAPSSGPSTTVTGIPIVIYLVDRDVLVPVTRTVDLDEPTRVLDQLSAQPASSETQRGLRSALADEGTRLAQGIDVERGVATIDLSPEFTDLDSASQVLALAQLVYTFTARAGTGQVALTISGRPIQVPRGDGTLTNGPLTRADYPHAIAPS